jgi:hypothetical protein
LQIAVSIHLGSRYPIVNLVGQGDRNPLHHNARISFLGSRRWQAQMSYGAICLIGVAAFDVPHAKKRFHITQRKWETLSDQHRPIWIDDHVAAIAGANSETVLEGAFADLCEFHAGGCGGLQVRNAFREGHGHPRKSLQGSTF